MGSEYVLHLRGLPYSSTEESIVSWFENDASIDTSTIANCKVTQNDDGRHSGEAFISFTDQGAAEQAETLNRKDFPGSRRYVEIRRSDPERMQRGTTNTGGQSGGFRGSGNWDGIVKMRGLPFKSSVTDVEDFFSGLSWAQNGIFFPLNNQGESTGQAYVQFDTFSNAEMALERNKNLIGGRYIELFKSNNTDMRKAMIEYAKVKSENNWQNNSQASYFGPTQSWGGLQLGGGMNGMSQGGAGGAMNGNFGGSPMGQVRASPYAKPAAQINTGTVQTAPNNSPFPHVVGMQGVEATMTNSQIQEFFKPAKAVAINMLGNGHCDVAFKTHQDALDAMAKDRARLGHQEVNLTLKSQAPSGWSAC